MASRSKERQEVIEAKRNPRKWQELRDEELDEPEYPDPDDDAEPIHTLH